MHVSPWPLFSLDDFMGSLDEMLDEHFGGDGDDEGGIVGAGCYVVVCVDDLFDSGHWYRMSVVS